MNYYQMKKKDIQFGKYQEDKIKEDIENFFNIKIKKSEKEFCSYDFKCKGIRIELKSRNIKSDKYDTTLLCKSKIDYYKKIKNKKRFILIFNFLDKIKYLEFNEDILKYPIEKVFIARGEIVENIKIPIHLLQDLKDH